jgi:hypothetical protein
VSAIHVYLKNPDLSGHLIGRVLACQKSGSTQSEFLYPLGNAHEANTPSKTIIPANYEPIKGSHR